MKDKCFILMLVLCSLIACNKRQDIQSDKGEQYMRWEDEYFMQICRQVFHKQDTFITYDDVSKIEKISYVGVDGKGMIEVSLSGGLEAKVVDIPEISMKSVADLKYFKNLTHLEVVSNKFASIETFETMPELKTLVLKSRKITTKTLKEISKYSHVESLVIPFLDIDYSCLSDLSTLKAVTVTTAFSQEPNDYGCLQSLPSEGCLLDLSFINEVKLTPDLYEVLETHTNIAKLGSLYIPENCDLSFFKDMEALDTIRFKVYEFSGDNMSAIAQMNWLKEVTIWGDRIDTDFLSKLPNLERLELSITLSDYQPQDLSISTLGEHDRLEELKLHSFMIENLDGIDRYPKLKSLTVNHCYIQDISGLKFLGQLEHIDLDDNLIKDIGAFQNLKNLKYLSMQRNEIDDISVLHNCPELEFLDLTDNMVTDIDALEGFEKLEDLRLECNFSSSEDGFYAENDRRLIAWRNILLSLPNLKYYVGGPPVNEQGWDDWEWISENLPNVKYGYRDIVEWRQHELEENQ